ncbi:hypothetical protein [Saccharothrix variisporea]|uniref:Uncharacterized protein n=1 Tax=Saccharothrix variisporea TaxID=543527 RepID=A0A495XRU3_9PSEU|nr:hypothetical protein [Saccharothrix variisporea]RKT74388.1 hypothetical protein DFJ66_7737 [Saccharothrix variisporea]
MAAAVVVVAAGAIAGIAVAVGAGWAWLAAGAGAIAVGLLKDWLKSGTAAAYQHIANPLVVTVEVPAGQVVVDRSTGEHVPVSGHQVSVLVQTRSSQAVVLRDMRVVVERRRPPGPGLPAVAAGALSRRQFEMDLDQREPVLRPEDGGTPEFPYKVAAGDPELFTVTARTTADEVWWWLELDWRYGLRTGTERIGRDGKPFRTAPVPPNTARADGGAG